MATARRNFEIAHIAAKSRIDILCTTEGMIATLFARLLGRLFTNVKTDPSGEDFWEALFAVRNMELLYTAVQHDSRSLTSLLQQKRSKTNTQLGVAAGGGALLALYAIGFFFGSTGLAHSSLYAWITAGTVTATATAGSGIAGALVFAGSSGAATYKIVSERSEVAKGEALDARNWSDIDETANDTSC